MTKKDFMLILVLLVIGFILGLFVRGCGAHNTIKTFPAEMDSLINLQKHRADSIQKEVQQRDSLLAVIRVNTDTVIRHTDKYVYLYRNTTDTVMKLMSCDSIVIGYENLKGDYLRSDSLHVINENGLQMAVGYLRSALDTAQSGYDQLYADNVQLEKKNKRLKFFSVVSSSIAILAVGAFIAK